MTSRSRYSFSELADFARQAGWEEQEIPQAVAIAMAESGGNPMALNDNPSTGDKSFGLMQVNMIGRMGPERLRQFGLQSVDELYNPVTNFRAAKAIRDSQGWPAWSVYKSGRYKNFLPSIEQSLSSTPASVGATAPGGTDPLSAALGSIFGAGATTQAAVAPAKDKAMGIDFVEQLREIDPGAAAQVAAVTALLPQRSAAAAEIASIPSTAAGGTSAPAGGLKVIEYLTGDPGHAGYRDDHGGSNYHEHLAFETKTQRDVAMRKLKAAGIQIGSVNDGKHSPNSYHYQDLAFDVPAAQVPVGQERELSRRVRSILGIG